MGNTAGARPRRAFALPSLCLRSWKWGALGPCLSSAKQRSGLNYSTFQKYRRHLHRRGLLKPACTHKIWHFLRNQRNRKRGEQDRAKPQSHLVSPTHKRANTESPKLPHRNQPHSHFYLKWGGGNVRMAGEVLEIKHPQRKKTPLPLQSRAVLPAPRRVSLPWGISPCSSFSFSSYDSGTRF